MDPQEIEIERLNLEKERLNIEKERLQIERIKATSDRGFLNRHLGVVISLAAILVSITQVLTAYITARDQLGVQLRSQQFNEKLSRAQLILTHFKDFSSPDPKESNKATLALLSTFGPEQTSDLLTDILDVGSPDAQSAAKDGLQYVEFKNLAKQSRLEAWDGTWNYEFKSSKGKFSGSMTLKSNTDGNITGTFESGDKSIAGSIQGKLSDDRKILDGVWINNAGRGQRGRLLFILNQESDPLTFAGSYSMLGEAPKEESTLTWTGTKSSAQ